MSPTYNDSVRVLQLRATFCALEHHIVMVNRPCGMTVLMLEVLHELVPRALFAFGSTIIHCAGVRRNTL